MGPEFEPNILEYIPANFVEIFSKTNPAYGSPLRVPSGTCRKLADNLGRRTRTIRRRTDCRMDWTEMEGKIVDLSVSDVWIILQVLSPAYHY